MARHSIHIGIIESSQIISEGIESMLLKGDAGTRITRIHDIEAIDLSQSRLALDLVLINASQVVNRLKILRNLKCSFPTLKWIGLIFSAYERDILLFFDDTIGIDDTHESIWNKIRKQLTQPARAEKTETLSERETEILKEIARGKSNKQIADRLHISINTVMSHRKNIVQKTKIRSQAGLTVFALTNNILSIDTI